MDDGSQMRLGLIGCLISLALLAFLTACETAAAAVNDARLKKNAETDKKAQRLLKLLSRPNSFMTAALVARSFMMIAFSVIAQAGFFPPLAGWICRNFAGGELSGSRFRLACLAAFAAIIICSAFIISTFGIILPRRLASGSGKSVEKFAYGACGIYSFLLALWRPVERISSILVSGILRVFGVKNGSDRDAVTEEEILMMVDAVNETGGIEESQKEMINNIFEFDDLAVKDVMTHRTSVHAVELGASAADAVRIATEDGFSRIPVYEQSLDSICGVIFAKDLLKAAFQEDPEQIRLTDFIREIMYVPETKGCGELFKEFTAKKNQIAVAVDEYGGTAGIVTMEDLIEAIVGNIQDEYDHEEEEIQEITPNTFDILGTAQFGEVMERIGQEYSGENEYDTIGAFVIDLLGRFPEAGERPSAVYKNVRFTVIVTDDKKIIRLRAAKIPLGAEKANQAN